MQRDRMWHILCANIDCAMLRQCAMCATVTGVALCPLNISLYKMPQTGGRSYM